VFFAVSILYAVSTLCVVFTLNSVRLSYCVLGDVDTVCLTGKTSEFSDFYVWCLVYTYNICGV
jgi:hypothetical protein